MLLSDAVLYGNSGKFITSVFSLLQLIIKCIYNLIKEIG